MKQTTIDKLDDIYILCDTYLEWLTDQPSLLAAWEKLYHEDKENFIESFRMLDQAGRDQVSRDIMEFCQGTPNLRLANHSWVGYLKYTDVTAGVERVADFLYQKYAPNVSYVLEQRGFTQEEIYGENNC